MSHILPPWAALSAFLVASLVLCVTPGPGVIYIVTRAVSQGRRAGIASAAGIALGNLSNAVLASVGLAAVFAASSVAYLIVRYAGAAYLLYLGLRMVLHSGEAGGSAIPPASLAKAFRDGLLVALLNPKTALFFAAFVPQFVNPAAPVMIQSLALSITFVFMAAVTDSLYALGTGTASRLLQRSSARVAKRVAGGVYIALAVATVTSGSRSSA